MYKKILLAVDGSEHSMRSTLEAVKVAGYSEDVFVEIVYVADFSKAKNEILHAHDKEELELTRRKKLQPFEEKFKEKGIPHRIIILHGDPAPMILEYTKKEKFDLLVIGSKGKNPLQEAMLGSVSHKVIKRVECPVLLVK
jgi:nucleotide-binding universal stress UspA family protein